MIVTDDSVTMTLREFDDLLEYSCSMPTGVRDGKRWKRREPYMIQNPDFPTWWMGEYVDRGDPDKVDIIWRQIFIGGVDG